jgi:hypothetical protein
LKNSRRPAKRSSVLHVITGVRWVKGAIRAAASRMSSGVGTEEAIRNAGLGWLETASVGPRIVRGADPFFTAFRTQTPEL